MSLRKHVQLVGVFLKLLRTVFPSSGMCSTFPSVAFCALVALWHGWGIALDPLHRMVAIHSRCWCICYFFLPDLPWSELVELSTVICMLVLGASWSCAVSAGLVVFYRCAKVVHSGSHFEMRVAHVPSIGLGAVYILYAWLNSGAPSSVLGSCWFPSSRDRAMILVTFQRRFVLVCDFQWTLV